MDFVLDTIDEINQDNNDYPYITNAFKRCRLNPWSKNSSLAKNLRFSTRSLNIAIAPVENIYNILGKPRIAPWRLSRVITVFKLTVLKKVFYNLKKVNRSPFNNNRKVKKKIF